MLDCLPGNDRNIRTANKAVFREAVKLYHMGSFEKSLEEMEKAKAYGSDPVADMYISYIKEHSRVMKG